MPTTAIPTVTTFSATHPPVPVPLTGDRPVPSATATQTTLTSRYIARVPAAPNPAQRRTTSRASMIEILRAGPGPRPPPRGPLPSPARVIFDGLAGRAGQSGRCMMWRPT